MTDTLLTIVSNHKKTPTLPVNSPELYVGYFQNCHGEQWVFTYDRATRLATVTGGDVSWDYYVVEESGTAPLVMSTEERLWLMACWHAATRTPLPPPK